MYVNFLSSLLLYALVITTTLAEELPDLGDVSSAVLTPLEEQSIAEQILRDVSRSNEILRDTEITDYLQSLGDRLVSSSSDNRQRFRFFMVHDNGINAFATFGALIFVHTGLILATESESELASVLGHEIGHVTQRHLVRLLAFKKQDVLKNIAGLALALLLARGNSQLASGALTASMAMGVQNQLDFTRANEREADRVGLQILERGGFDVRAMPAFFSILQRGTRFLDGSTPSFLRTHPLTEERIADVANRVAQIPYRQVTNSQEFQYVRAKLFALKDTPHSAVQQALQNLREHRYVDEATARYGLAISALSARNFMLAEEQLNWLSRNAKRHHMTENVRAQLAVLQGNTAQALHTYQVALQYFPDNRALIYGYLEQLIVARRHIEALKLIKEAQKRYPDDAILFESIANIYAAQGKILLSHQAQGEAYFYRYDIARAVEQMELASKANDGDFYQKSIVEARLKTLRQLLSQAKRAAQ